MIQLPPNHEPTQPHQVETTSPTNSHSIYADGSRNVIGHEVEIQPPIGHSRSSAWLNWIAVRAWIQSWKRSVADFYHHSVTTISSIVPSWNQSPAALQTPTETFANSVGAFLQNFPPANLNDTVTQIVENFENSRQPNLQKALFEAVRTRLQTLDPNARLRVLKAIRSTPQGTFTGAKQQAVFANIQSAVLLHDSAFLVDTLKSEAMSPNMISELERRIKMNPNPSQKGKLLEGFVEDYKKSEITNNIRNIHTKAFAELQNAILTESSSAYIQWLTEKWLTPELDTEHETALGVQLVILHALRDLVASESLNR